MKKTQIKDARRNIHKQRVSYLSIVVIAMLAVTAYLGIMFEAETIKNNANRFYDEANFRDLEAVSTLLVTEDDLSALRLIDGVADVEGVMQSSGVLHYGELQQNVDIVSLTERVNKPVLVEGRLPQAANECAVEVETARDLSLKPGDSILLNSTAGSPAEYLTVQEFVLTGVVMHPDHPTWQVVLPGNRDVVVLPEAFDTAALNGSYMKAEILLSKDDETNRLSDDYRASVDGILAALDSFGVGRAELRTAQIQDIYQEQIEENQEKLDSAGKELKDARELLDEGIAEIDKSQQELDSAEETLAQNKKKLDDGRAELDRSKRKLNSAAAELAEGKAKLDESAAQLEEARLKLEDTEAQLADGKAQLDAGEAQLTAAKKELDEGKAKLDDAAAEISAGSRALRAGRSQLNAGAAQIAAGEAQLADAENTLTTGYAEIEGKKQDVRDTIKDALETTITSGGISAENASAAVESIAWASPNTSPDLSDTSLDATRFNVTENIGFNLSQVDYVETVSSAVDKYDQMFDAAAAKLEELGVDTTALVAGKDSLKTDFQTVLSSAADLENQYNTNVGLMQTWNDGHADYLTGVADLDNAKAAYASGLAQYNAGAAELSAGRAQYNQGLELYNSKLEEYEAGLAEFESKRQEYEDALALYNEGKAQYEDGLAQYEEGLATYEESEKLYEDGLAEYQEGERQYRSGLAQYNEGLKKYEDGKRQLEEGRATLAEKEKEYADGLAQYNDGKAQLDNARSALASLDPARWVLLGPESNPGYIYIRNNQSNVSNLGSTFALLFVLVGALVIYATVGRIVDEQRRLVGATKALGLYNREIFSKYLLFGVSATLVGMLLGVAAAYFIIQRVLMYSYGQFYVYGGGIPSFLPVKTAVVLAGGLLLSTAAVWTACTDLLKSTATSLLQEKAPAGAKNKSGNSALPLYWRLVLLNMRSDKKRVAVTIVSVAGCCALLVAGFTMRSSIMQSLDRQFSSIATYDARISYDTEVSDTAGTDIAEALSASGVESIGIYRGNLTYSIGGKIKAAELLCGSFPELDGYFARLDPKTGEPLAGPDDGIFINVRTAQVRGLQTGDVITVYDGSMNPFSAKIAGIFNIHAGTEAIMSEKTYEDIFGQAPEKNAFLIHLNGASMDSLRAELEQIPGITQISEIREIRETYQGFAGILNLIVAILTGIAGLMAYFIILNLASMYINQKKRELTIMRINGFTTKEVIRYVAGESVATTVAGIILGIVLGSLLGYRMLRLLENEQLHFIHSVQPGAWGIAILITIVFSLVIYSIALRPVKDLKLTDVA